MTAMPAVWWTLGIAGFAGWMIFVVQQMEARLSTLFASSPTVMNLIKNIGGGDAAAAPRRAPGSLRGAWLRDRLHWGDHAARVGRCRRGLRTHPRPGQLGGGHAGHDPAGSADRRRRLPGRGLAPHRRRHRASELPLTDLVFHQLHRTGTQVAGCHTAPVALLLLRHAAAARAASGSTARGPRRQRRRTESWRAALRPQRHRGVGSFESYGHTGSAAHLPDGQDLLRRDSGERYRAIGRVLPTCLRLA